MVAPRRTSSDMSEFFDQWMQHWFEVNGYERDGARALGESQVRASRMLRRVLDAWCNGADALAAANTRALQSWSELAQQSFGRRGLARSQVLAGDPAEGRHRVIVLVTLCERGRCADAVEALASKLNFSASDLARVVTASAVGQFIKLEIPEPATATDQVLELVLRDDLSSPGRVDDLKRAARHLLRYLGSKPGLSTRDVALVPLGAAPPQSAVDLASLVSVLHAQDFPGVVYNASEAGHGLDDAQLRAIGVAGGRVDPLPVWPCPPRRWTREDEKRVLGPLHYADAGQITPFAWRDV